MFVTTGDVAELRRRVSAMAQMHDEHHAKMGAMPAGNQAGDDHSAQAGHDMGSGATSDQDMSGHDMGGQTRAASMPATPAG